MRNFLLRLRRSESNLWEAFSATSVSLLCRVAAAGFSFLLSLLVARKLGAEGSGVLALASTIMTMACTLSLFGLDYLSVRAVAASQAAQNWSALRAWIKTASIIAISAGFVLSAALWFGSGTIALLLGGSPALSSAIAVIGLAVVPTVSWRLLSAFLRGMRSIVWSSIIDPLLFPILTVAIIFARPVTSVYDVVHIYPVSAVIVAVIGIACWLSVARAIPKARSNFDVRLALVRSLPIYGSILGGFASPWITTLCIGALASEAQTGVYRVAFQFGLILSFPDQAAAMGLAPQLAALHAVDRLHTIKDTARRLIFAVLLLGGIPALFFFIFADQLLAIFGSEFVAGSTALRIMVVASTISLAFGPVGSVMVMTGLERPLFVISIVSSILVTLLSIVLIPEFGATGAAAASSIATIFRLITQTVVVWRARGLLLPLGIVRQTPVLRAPSRA